jgi:hypothetical protein
MQTSHQQQQHQQQRSQQHQMMLTWQQEPLWLGRCPPLLLLLLCLPVLLPLRGPEGLR